jgi:predicted transcriptional regulator
MRSEDVRYFTPREEELVAILVDLGLRKSSAKALIYLAHTNEATSHDIERSTDLRQSEVSLAVKYLWEHGWITHHENNSGSHGRPVKIYKLTTPLTRIIDTIEKEKMTEVTTTLNRIEELRGYTL